MNNGYYSNTQYNNIKYLYSVLGLGYTDTSKKKMNIKKKKLVFSCNFFKKVKLS